MALTPVSMALTNSEKVDRARPMTEGTPVSDIPDYSYGLTLHLGTLELQKLGLNSDGKLAPGQMLNIIGRAMVTEVEANREGGMTKHSASIQVQELGMQPAGNEADRAQAIFGPDAGPTTDMSSGGNNAG